MAEFAAHAGAPPVDATGNGFSDLAIQGDAAAVTFAGSAHAHEVVVHRFDQFLRDVETVLGFGFEPVKGDSEEGATSAAIKTS
jgi:hypothetical protein